jgi:excisionase family DNA binding protein
MGRVLRGSVRTHDDGSATCSVLKRVGSKDRVKRQFRRAADGQAWVDACVAALEQGLPLPDAGPYQLAAKAGTSNDRQRRILLSEAVWSWWHMRYVVKRKASPDRRDGIEALIRNHILPYFESRATYLDELKFEDLEAFMVHLAGADLRTAPRTGVAASVQMRMLTLAEAAAAVGRSKSAMRRAYQYGRFPHAVRDTSGLSTGTILVPAGDLVDAGFTFGNTRAGRPGVTGSLSKSTSSEILRVLRGAVAYANARNLITFDPTHGVEALPPVPAYAARPPDVIERRILSYQECFRVAGHLHLHHQVAFWLQRILGLRVGEVFGIRVGSINEWGYIELVKQGGKRFVVYDDFGNDVIVDEKDLKTRNSARGLVVPAPLLELIYLYIAAVHTDPETGDVDPTARLILPMRAGKQAGQASYTTALRKAFINEGLTHETLGFHVSSHHLRRSLGGDLASVIKVTELLRSRLLGHKPSATDGGSQVTMDYYTPTNPDVSPLYEVAASIADQIRAELPSLLAPAPAQTLLGTAPLTPEQRMAAEHVLEQAMGEPGREVSGVVIAEAARQLGVSVTKVNRLLDEGVLASMVGKHATGSPVRMVPLASLEAYLASQLTHRSFPEAAEVLGVSYVTLYKWYHEGRIEAGPLPGHTGLRISDETVESLATLFREEAALRATMMTLSEAATTLRRTWNTVDRLAKEGTLEIGRVVEGPRAVYVTRASVEAYRARSQRSRDHRLR